MKRNWLIAAGLLAGAHFLIGIIVVGLLMPGYEPARQFVSELGAIGAPTAPLLNYAVLLPAGALILASGLGRVLAGEVLSGILIAGSGTGFILAGLYSCDEGCGFANMSPAAMIHNQAAFGAFIAAILAALILALGALRRHRWRAAISAAGAMGMIGGLGSMMQLGLASEWIGLAQRGFLFSFCLWIAADSALRFRAGRVKR